MDTSASGPLARLHGGALDGLRRRLEALRAELTATTQAEARELATPAAERGEDTTPSQADVASDVAAREELILRELGQTDELREVEAALTRIARGTYGICIDCGRPIALERLKARPHASRDVQCEARAEQGERPASR